MHQTPEADCCFNEKDAAQLLGVSVHTLRSWRQRNRGPAFLKLGTRVLYRRSAIARFLDESEHYTLDDNGPARKLRRVG